MQTLIAKKKRNYIHMNEYNSKRYYLIAIAYTQLALKHCNDVKYNTYNTQLAAKEACTLDSNCAGVYDNGCDEGAGDVYLCPVGTTYASSSSSCILEKGNIWYFLAKLRTQHK